jgi:hypothetical protein
MKHLKSFNEDITSFNFEEDLQDFCETNLAYLLDEAELQVIESPGGWSELHLIRILLNEPKRWNEIKDHMIPFLTRLENKYEINNQPFKNSSYYGYVRVQTRTNRDQGFGVDQAFPGKKLKSKVEDIRLYISFDDNLTSSVAAPSYMKCYIKDLIEDKSTWPNARISDIRLYVKGYKQGKKSILTKIKSFFK